jgi:hypothetical protein
MLLSLAVLLVTISLPALAQAPDTAWVRSYNGPAGGDDQGTSCAVDAWGNLYVTGFSSNGANHDFLTIKYNSTTGETLWTRRYNGPDNGNDGGTGCAVDNSGSLYVFGSSFQAGTNDDYLTIKYDAATGETLWTRRHEEPGDASNKSWGCSYSATGHLYVTGMSHGGGPECDYLTVKYDAVTGDTLWVRKYNGPAGGDDEAFGCAADPWGNLYVSGYSFNGSDFNILTVKYSPDGDTLWTRRSAATLDSLRHDMAGCASDGSGNVYVTGMCGLNAGYQNRYSVTIKYGPAGELLWTRTYDGPTNYDATMGCAADPARNTVIVTGTTHTGGPHDRFLTVCYDADSSYLVWDVSYLSSPARTEYSMGCALDSNGYLFVSGVSLDSLTWIGDYQTVKYNTATGVAGGPGSGSAVAGLRLLPNAPNPFSQSTIIKYQLTKPSTVILKVYNGAGQCVRDLTPSMPPSPRGEGWVGSVIWDGRDGRGRQAANGVYLCRLETATGSTSRKMTLVK